jgi:predicted AAA+ superfamily ATPase
MHERRKAKVVVSGSNAKLLSRELGTLLTGRHLDVTVYPLSFGEFLRFNNMSVKDERHANMRRVEIRTLLRKYIEFGAFPEIGFSERKKELLLAYFEDLVTKDLLRRFRIRKENELRALARFYLSNVSCLTTFSTVEKFAACFEQVYLIFFLKRFTFKLREQEKSPRKVYVIDTGLSNAVGFRFSENIGRLAENIVFLELKRLQASNPELELFYWKDIHHREVDFVLKQGQKVKSLIQVCWNIADFKTKDREIRSLLKAIGELNQENAVVVTEDYESVDKINGQSIHFVPLWKWLLKPCTENSTNDSRAQD